MDSVFAISENVCGMAFSDDALTLPLHADRTGISVRRITAGGSFTVARFAPL